MTGAVGFHPELRRILLFHLKILRKEAQNTRWLLSGAGFCYPERSEGSYFHILRFFTKEAQNDRVCGLVILNAVKDLTFHLKILRKRLSNDRVCGLSSECSEGSCFFHIKILRKRSSE